MVVKTNLSSKKKSKNKSTAKLPGPAKPAGLIHKSVFIHPHASVDGLVEIGENSSVWGGAVIRADMNEIKIGRCVNIQDNCTLHVDSYTKISIGDYSLIGHNCMLHGCKIGRGVLVGIGSIVLENAEIGDGAILTAGCLVRGKKKIPPGSLVISKNGDLVIYEGKASARITVAHSLEYV